MKEEKRNKIKKLLHQLSQMSEEQKKVLAEKLGIMNPEGHILSARNQILLYNQNPEMNFSVVAGFKQWLKFGRCVEKGQRGFLIAVPSKKEEQECENPEIEKSIFFLWKTVFDISQTFELQKEQAA